MLTRLLLVPICLCLALPACSDRPKAPERPRALYSPFGEYLGLPQAGECDGLVDGWLARVDRNRDGRIDLAELKTNAEQVFSQFDQDRDGYVTPLELAAVRKAMGVPAPAEQPLPEGASGRPVLGGPGGAPRGRSSEPTRQPGPLRGPGIDTAPDSFMAADINLDFRVSRDELLAYAERRFQQLDRDRAGALGRADLAALCAGRR